MPAEPMPRPDPLAAFRLDGSIAVVTGASSGLGHRFARVLHAAGAQVVVSGRRAERLDELVSAHADMVAVAGDVADDDDRRRLVAAAVELEAAGDRRFDVLVNNAGIGYQAAAEDEDLDDFARVVDVNLTSLFRLSQLAARHFLGRGDASIVNVASMLGLVASAPINQASYVASKGGVVSLTRELGCQWARRGVRVNAIAPGWFPSEMTSEKMLGDERSMQFLRRNCPAGRPGEEHELDGALLFLASRASTYVTGQTLTVDGGWTAR